MLKEMADVDAARLGRALRRTRITSIVLGLVAVVVAAVVGYPTVGLGVVAGLVVGAMNTRWADASVAHLKDTVGPKAARRPIAMRTLGRLAVSTAIVLGLLILATPMGFGALGGLVLYQVAFLSNMLRAVMSGGAPQ